MTRTLAAAALVALAISPAVPAAWGQEPPPAEPAAQQPAAQEPAPQPEEPAPEISFDELLAAEEESAVDAAEAAARRSRIPFQARSRPLQGLPAGMAALIMGSRPGGQVVSSVLAVPLGDAVPLPPPPPPPPVEDAADEAAAAAPPAAEPAAGPPRQPVMLIVEIDGPSLLGPAPGEVARLEVFAYALAPNGGVAAFLSQRLELDLAEMGEALFAGGVKLVGHLELPAGEYILRVLVHEAESQRYGLRAVPLLVPSGPGLSPPLVAEPAAGEAASPWFLVVESPHGAWGRIDFGEVLHRAGTPLPSALPVLPGDEAELDVLVAAGAAVGERLEARLLDNAGEPAATLSATVLARRATDLPGFERLRVRLPLDELAVGSYYLTLAGEVGGAAATSAELPLVVTRDAGGAGLWTEIERRLSGGEARAEIELGGEGRGRRGRRNERAERAVVAAYRAVLARLAGGDRDGAAADLARIEAEVLAGVPEEPFAVLTLAQDRVQAALAGSDPEALLPVALLHTDVYRRQREVNAFGLATRSRTQAVAAAERYAAASRIDEAGSFASAVLATIGDELQRAQVRRTARDLLERATALESDNRFALLHLAAGLEKTADYAGAVGVLRRLISVDPKAPEGRLRLAINLLRLGHGGEATTILERLIAEDNPPWVLAIAYETLADVRLRGGDAAGAAALLRRGAARLPAAQRLLVQLAYTLERAGQSGEASEVLNRLDAAVGGPSPRHQYHLWPEGGRDELVRRLVQAGLVRLPSLEAALDAVPEESRR